jgi:hypothetical protein
MTMMERMSGKVRRHHRRNLRSKPPSQTAYLSENSPKGLSQHRTQEKEKWQTNSQSHRQATELHPAGFRIHRRIYGARLYAKSEASRPVGNFAEIVSTAALHAHK